MKYLPFMLLAGLIAGLGQRTRGQETNGLPAAPPSTLPSLAATNSATSTNTAPPARPPTEIVSDSANFDLKTRIAVYIGHVIVKDPQMTMTCGIMTAKLPESGRIDSIVAEQNVVIDAVDNQGRPVHATADKATYSYFVSGSVTNEIITLTGSPYLKSENWWGTGETITWDRGNGSVSAKAPHMYIRPETGTGSNAIPANPALFK
jgi:lipopolysaccharide transport protein LptA